MSGQLTRRRFLSAALGAAAPLVLPRTALGFNGRPGANSRIVTGHIGLDARGRGHLGRLRDNAGALCDFDTTRLNLGLAMTGRVMDAVTDYQRVLDARHIDAVVISVPDHWRAIIAVHAMQAGKDVYLESPVCYGPEGARALSDTAAFYGAVLHAALPLLDSTEGQAALRAVRESGAPPALAALTAAANPAAGDASGFAAPPPSLDWERWLGPAPHRAYHPLREAGWRWMMDIGGGRIRSEGVQQLALVLAAIEGASPASFTIAASGTPQSAGIWDAPASLTATWTVPGVEIGWQQPGAAGAPRVALSREGGRVAAVEAFHMELPYVPGALPRPDDAIGLWLNSIETRADRTRHLALACHAATLASAANAVYLRGLGSAVFDEATGQLDDAVANTLLREPARGAAML